MILQSYVGCFRYHNVIMILLVKKNPDFFFFFLELHEEVFTEEMTS